MRLGQIVGAHGLRGQLKVEPLTDFFERFAKGTVVTIQGVERTITEFTVHKGRPLIRVAGISDMTTAQQLQWAYVEGADEELELDDDEFLIEDLIGMRVVTTEGRDLGVVTEVLENPAHEILVAGDVLIPFVDEFVGEIDDEAKVILVKLIPGMLA